MYERTAVEIRALPRGGQRYAILQFNLMPIQEVPHFRPGLTHGNATGDSVKELEGRALECWHQHNAYSDPYDGIRNDQPHNNAHGRQGQLSKTWCSSMT